MHHTPTTTLLLLPLLACAPRPTNLDVSAYPLPRCIVYLGPDKTDNCEDTPAHRATLAVGLCTDTPTVYLSDALIGYDYEGPVAWTVNCSAGTYLCDLDFDGENYHVSCSYSPICSEDTHSDNRSAIVQ